MLKVTQYLKLVAMTSIILSSCFVKADAVVMLQPKAGQQQMDTMFDMYEIEGKVFEASTTEAYGTHEHGVAALTIMLDNNELSLALTLPALHLLQAEHATLTKDDQQKVRGLKTQFKRFEQMFTLQGDANCQLQGVTVEVFLDEVNSKTQEVHSDIEAVWAFNCTSLKNLQAIVPHFFSIASGLKRLKADWLKAERASSVDLLTDTPILLR